MSLPDNLLCEWHVHSAALSFSCAISFLLLLFYKDKIGKSLKVSRSETTIERPHLSFHLRLGLQNGFFPTYKTTNTLPPPVSFSSFFFFSSSSSSSSFFFFFFFLFCFSFSRIRIICSESNGQFLNLAFPSFYWSSYFSLSPHTL